MTETETEEQGTSSTFKIGISVWLSFCLFICLWFLSRFMTGRRQLRNNLHVIEDGLKRMQDEIEKRQKDKDESYADNLEEFMEELLRQDRDKVAEVEKEKAERAGAIIEEEKKESEENADAEETELLVKDKKND